MSGPSIVTATLPAPSTKTATIANGASLSAALDLGSHRLAAVAMPAAWTAADLTFQASADGTNYFNLHDNSDTEYTVQADASRFIVPNSDLFRAIRYLKVRSGTGAAAVNQGAERILTLVVMPA